MRKNHCSRSGAAVVTDFNPSRCIDEGFDRNIRPCSQTEGASSIDNNQERDLRTETDLDLVSAFDDVQGADSNVIAYLYFGRM